jgi:serine/threonine protein kinase
MPSIQKSNNPNENCYILNYIKTRNKLNKCLIKKVCSGGFTSIYLAEIEYWYVASYNLGVSDGLKDSCSQNPHKKYVIIKREDNKMLEEGRKSRIAHERFILTRIKNGVSIFLNKYYLLAEKDNNFENDLLSDFIDYPNLYDYCQKNKETMSFQTKIYLCIMVAQSLRYLSEYKIAHLDLKPTNIMTNRKLTIKLIDFGESFHPELKSKCHSMQAISPDSPCPTPPLRITSFPRTTATKMMSFP